MKRPTVFAVVLFGFTILSSLTVSMAIATFALYSSIFPCVAVKLARETTVLARIWSTYMIKPVKIRYFIVPHEPTIVD
jgi:hypothetical protein